jgi:3',5'-cyclic AMP phosphodiesterase CpdA
MLPSRTIVFLAVFIASPTILAHEAGWLTAPYLQNVKPGGITIMWERGEAEDARVEFGLRADFVDSVAAVSVDSGFGSRIYKAVLTGLRPGATYFYRIAVDGAEPSRVRTFRTASAGPEPFSFGVWSDSQGQNKGAFPEDILEPTKAMMRHMAESGIDIALTSGDLAETGGDYTDVRNFFLDRVAKYLGQTVPYFIAWGNHEPNRDDVIRKFADMPSKDRPGMDPGWGSFSFDYAGAHFVCIDYGTMKEDIETWLEGDLQSDVAQAARFTFLFIHVPPYCELWIDGDDLLRAKLVPLLEKYGVDAVFSGHTHEYERGFKDHVHYVITGGGSWLDLTEPVVKDWDHMFVGGAQDLAEFKHGLVNEYVRVDVGMDAWTGRMHAFQPSGAYIGVRDVFGSLLQDADGDGFLTDAEREMPANFGAGAGTGPTPR